MHTEPLTHEISHTQSITHTASHPHTASHTHSITHTHCITHTHTHCITDARSCIHRHTPAALDNLSDDKCVEHDDREVGDGLHEDNLAPEGVEPVVVLVFSQVGLADVGLVREWPDVSLHLEELERENEICIYAARGSVCTRSACTSVSDVISAPTTVPIVTDRGQQTLLPTTSQALT